MSSAFIYRGFVKPGLNLGLRGRDISWAAHERSRLGRLVE